MRLRCCDTIWPPAACTISTVAAAGPAIMSQPTTDAPSPANAKAAARPMLPPVPVITQTFPASPAISVTSVLVIDQPEGAVLIG